MFFCYARVSTDEQDARSQMAGIREMLAKKGIGPDDPLKVKWISDEGVSGVVEWRRRGLGKALRAAKRGDTIVASEISRLARSLGQLFEFVGACHDKGVTVETVKDGWRLDGTMQSKMVMVFMGLAAEMERDLLVQRTREGLARARRDGVKLGRPKGSKKKHPKLEGADGEILRLLAKGWSAGRIAKKLHVHPQTLRMHIRNNGLTVNKGDTEK